ncbi:hypothetical protein FOZ60_010554, partial [Perkinsus olseni]
FDKHGTRASARERTWTHPTLAADTFKKLLFMQLDSSAASYCEVLQRDAIPRLQERCKKNHDNRKALIPPAHVKSIIVLVTFYALEDYAPTTQLVGQADIPKD